MPLTVLYNVQRAQIASLELDASLSETHAATVEVTKHPVEKGSKISDHLRPEPETVQIEAMVSNTPMPNPDDPVTPITTPEGYTFDSRGRSDPTRAGAAYEELLRLKNAGELITVVTALRTYENMAITGLSVPRTVRDSNVLRFSINLEAVRQVNSQTVKVVTLEDKTKGKTKIGKKGAPETPEPTKSKSFLKSVKDTGVVQKGSDKLNRFLGLAK